ncbi:reverse transcriptase family protein [Vogesella indigofera]|uniref:reverse transcriptase family protein n=1 Tax=Vogesella indigofera TaxID=45465 RepID=UPI003F43679F
MTATSIKLPKKYPLESSPLFNLSSKKTLSELLRVDYGLICNFDASKVDGLYKNFLDKKTRRFINEPHGILLNIHKRILILLGRIIHPDYLHSAVKGRSYKTNALAHCGGGVVLKVDIKKFFPSIKFNRIHAFFSDVLHCSPDVSFILARLCSVQSGSARHLPTGSCISPLLSCLANRGLFDAIADMANDRKCTFTLYVDDMTISGEGADGDLLTAISKKIFSYGYGYHKIHVYRDGRALVTGLVVQDGKIYLPHSRAKKIFDLIKLMDVTKTCQKEALASLVGRLSEAEQIEGHYRVIRGAVLERYGPVWREVTADRSRAAHRAIARRRPRP